MRAKKPWRHRSLVLGGLAGASSVTGVGLAIALGTVNSPDRPVAMASLAFSTDPNRPNVVEVFSDGFDYVKTAALLAADPLFKDFSLFAHAYSMGGLSWAGIPPALGGFRDYAPVYLAADHPEALGSGISELAFGPFLNAALLAHMGDQSALFGQRAVVGTLNFTSAPSPSLTKWYGDSDFNEATLPGLDLANWTGMRAALAGTVGTTDLSPLALGAPFLAKVGRADALNAPLRVLVSDEITHKPLYTDANGDVATNPTGTGRFAAEVSNFARLVAALKGIVDAQGRSAYDNSLIVFFGDHADHFDRLTDEDEGSFEWARSAVMVKFPDERRSGLRTVADKTLYTPLLRDFIERFLVERPADPWTLFDGDNFALDREILVYGPRRPGFAFARVGTDGLLVPTGATYVPTGDPAVDAVGLENLAVRLVGQDA